MHSVGTREGCALGAVQGVHACNRVHKKTMLTIWCDMAVWSCVLQPCNPAVGGPAKSQLVHEVDALGGEMGKMADRCYLQKRVLNRSKVLPCLATQLDVSWQLGCQLAPSCLTRGMLTLLH